MRCTEDVVQKSQETLPVGTIIRGRYLIKSIIGQGSSGAVYLVQDSHVKTTNNIFALKEVHGLTAQEIYQFALSSVNLLKLHHAALAHIIDIPKDEKQERVYLLMEYIEGPDLETIWQQQEEQRFTWSKVKRIMSPIFDAVEYMHTQQPPIVHRDIKPVNIIVSETGEDAKLVDLGIVRTQQTGLEVDDLLAACKALEIFSSASDIRADIYGLGATCYTLLTGTMPPPALIRQAQIEGGNADPLLPAHQLVDTIPQSVAQAIQKAMSLKPDERFSSVRQFRAALYATEKRPSLIANKKPIVENFSIVETKTASTIQTASSDVLHTASLPKSEKQGQMEQMEQMEQIEQIAEKQEFVRRKDSTSEKHTSKQQTHWYTPSTKRIILPLVAVALLVSLLSLGTNFNFFVSSGNHAVPATGATHTASTPTLEPAKTQLPSVPSPDTKQYTYIAGLYAGTIYDIVPNISTTIAVNIQQIGGTLQGNVVLGPKIQGGGTFTGTIDASKHVQLLIVNASGQVTMLLQGSLQSATSLSGEYYSCATPLSITCHHSNNNYGLWNTLLMNQ